MDSLTLRCKRRVRNIFYNTCSKRKVRKDDPKYLLKRRAKISKYLEILFTWYIYVSLKEILSLYYFLLQCNTLCLEIGRYAFLMHRLGQVVPNIDIWGHIQRPHLAISNIQIVESPCLSRHCDYCRYLYHKWAQRRTLAALLVAPIGHCPSRFAIWYS